MPGFDGTGPQSMGPRTGGGRGYCAPGANAQQGYGTWQNRGAGRGNAPWGGGRGRVWGGGRAGGWQGQPAPAGAPEQEASSLQDQCAALEKEIRQLRQRLDELVNQNG